MSQHTKQALAESLIRLLRKKTLDKITIRDITDGCGVNRQTFYYHFEDIYSLVEYIFLEDPGHYIDLNTTTLSWMEACRELYRVLLHDKVLILNLYRSMEGRTLRKYMFKALQPAILKLARHLATDIPIKESDVVFVADSYTHGMIGLLIEWLDSNMREDFSADLDKFIFLLDGSMKPALLKMASLEK